MKSRCALVLGLGLSLLVSCGAKKKQTRHEQAGHTIAAVNYPLAYFAERLAGDFATIVFEAPADEDPAFWKPTDEQIARIQEADLILLNGATYAKWAATTSLPLASTVDTSSSFRSPLLEVKGTVRHAHGKKDTEHSHARTAFTTWLDLKQAAAQARSVADALRKNWPDQADAVMMNLAYLHTDLAKIDSRMRAATAKLKGVPVIASHPVYQYWERAYGLKISSLLWEPEMDLNQDAMTDLKKLMDANPGARHFIWEGDPLPENIEKLKAVGLTSVVISPCANRPADGDFLTVMQRNSAALESLPN